MTRTLPNKLSPSFQCKNWQTHAVCQFFAVLNPCRVRWCARHSCLLSSTGLLPLMVQICLYLIFPNKKRLVETSRFCLSLIPTLDIFTVGILANISKLIYFPIFFRFYSTRKIRVFKAYFIILQSNSLLSFQFSKEEKTLKHLRTFYNDYPE